MIVKLANTQIEKACDDGEESCRPILEHVLIDKNRAVASDGIMIAVVPLVSVDSDPDDKKKALIHRELLELGDKNDFFDVSESGACQGNIVIENEAQVDKFPDIDNIIPDVSNYQLVCFLDARLLFRLAQAICASPNNLGVKIYASPNLTDPIYIEPINKVQKGFGILMPMSVPRGAKKIRNLPSG